MTIPTASAEVSRVSEGQTAPAAQGESTVASGGKLAISTAGEASAASASTAAIDRATLVKVWAGGFSVFIPDVFRISFNHTIAYELSGRQVTSRKALCDTRTYTRVYCVAHMQAIEALAHRIAAKVGDPECAAAVVASMQLEMEMAFQLEQRAIAGKQQERAERVAAKLQHIHNLRKSNPTMQELSRMYDQVSRAASIACAACALLVCGTRSLQLAF